MKKSFTLKSVTLGLVTAAVVSLPFAGIASAASTDPSSDDVPVAIPHTTWNLDTAKGVADAAINHRLGTIGLLEHGVAGVKHTTACQSASMTTQLTADHTGLATLKATIDALPAGTTWAQFKPYALQITQNFRIYALETPKTHVVMACDRDYTIAGFLDAAATVIKVLHPADNVALIKADAVVARSSANAAVSKVISLTADKGDATVRTANLAALASGQANLNHAAGALHNGILEVKALLA